MKLRIILYFRHITYLHQLVGLGILLTANEMINTHPELLNNNTYLTVANKLYQSLTNDLHKQIINIVSAARFHVFSVRKPELKRLTERSVLI